MGSSPISGSGSYGGVHRAEGGGVREGLHNAADTVSRPGVLGGWDSCRSGVVGRHDGLRRRAGGPHPAQRQTQGNPLAAGLIAFGAGWLESSLLPATRREQQLAGQAKDVAQETAQAVAPTVRRAAEEVKENLRGPAEQAVESVRSTATDAGQTVADESKAAAAHVQDRAQDGRHRPGARQLELVHARIGCPWWSRPPWTPDPRVRPRERGGIAAAPRPRRPPDDRPARSARRRAA